MPLLALSLAAVAALAGAWGYRQTAALRRRDADLGRLTEDHAHLEKVYGELRAEVAARAARQAEVTDELQATLDHLRETRGQLLESRRLASLGQLTAGIAHEIKNPLNFVNNFGRLSVELADELREELEANPERPVAEVLDEVGDVLGALARNAAKITEHGERADRIVRTMLLHAGSSAGQRQPTDLNALVLDYSNLAFHAMRASNPDLRVAVEKDLQPDLGEVALVPQEVGRVVINLLTNAFHAVRERVEREGEGYVPAVTLATRDAGEAVEIAVSDNGVGMEDAVRARIFEPFFTTKPAGAGTGLGLSLSHEIVTTNHGGALRVHSEAGEGSTFVVTLPREYADG